MLALALFCLFAYGVYYAARRTSEPSWRPKWQVYHEMKKELYLLTGMIEGKFKYDDPGSGFRVDT